jgi:transcriptional regulator with GAF, ATPase, and Fis domain
VEPIPETREAIDEFGPFAADGDLLQQLMVRAEAVCEIVPDCVGLSIASSEYGVTFTLVASQADIALLDALQYATDGPCVDAVQQERVVGFADMTLLDEESWRLFGTASRQRGIASTLTLPVVVDGLVAGSVNMYAASAHAFTGHHQELATIFDAWAPGAVANADLSFTTRRVAERAPQKLRDEYSVEVAAGILASAEGLDLDTAMKRLREAAQRAGVLVAQLARVLIELQRRDTAE